MAKTGKSFLKTFGTGIFIGTTSSHQAFKKIQANIDKRGKDFTVDREEVRVEYNQYLRDNSKRGKVRSLRKRDYVKDDYAIKKQLYTGKRYHSVVEMVKWDDKLKKDISKWVTVTHDTLLTKGETENLAKSAGGGGADDDRYDDPDSYDRFNVDAIYENEDWELYY